MPTRFGNIGLLIKGTTYGVEISLKEPDRIKPEKIIIRLPENWPKVEVKAGEARTIMISRDGQIKH